MKRTILLAMAATVAAVSLPMTASANPDNAKEFRNAMRQASAARLNGGSNVLRQETTQQATATNINLLGSTLKTNAVDMNDSLFAILDVEQTSNMAHVSGVNSTLKANDVTLMHSRSISSYIDQTFNLLGMSAVNSTMTANSIVIH